MPSESAYGEMVECRMSSGSLVLYDRPENWKVGKWFFLMRRGMNAEKHCLGVLQQLQFEYVLAAVQPRA